MITHSSPAPAAIKSFTGLTAWKEAHAFVLMIYAATIKFPKDEMFGLTSQLRRATVSITSNLAEGFSRNSRAEKLRFYSISSSSICEVQNQILIARDVDYLTGEDFQYLAEKSVHVSKLIHGLMRSIRSRP